MSVSGFFNRCAPLIRLNRSFILIHLVDDCIAYIPRTPTKWYNVRAVLWTLTVL